MNDYIRSQISARQNSAVVKTKLLNLRSEFPVGIVLAVEGDEDKVAYSHWISRIDSRFCYEFLVCGGKPQVRKLKNAICNDLGDLSNDVMFLVDRDFDDLSGFFNADNVLMTERYSIENFIVDEMVLETLVGIAYPCEGRPGLRGNIRSLFRADYERFLEITRDINLQIFIARRLDLEIDDLVPRSLDQIVAIDIGNVSVINHDFNILNLLDIAIAECQIVEFTREFETLDPRLRYRGKFALKFLRKWLDKLAEEYRNSRIGLFGLLPERRIQHNELTFGAFAARSEFPQNLFQLFQQ